MKGVLTVSMVHDNIIKSYQVDFENKILALKTEYWSGDIHEKTDVIFTGYLTHIFHNVLEHSVIFDIEEYALNFFLEQEQELLEKQKYYGFPIIYKTKEELIDFFQSNGYKVFSIDSSWGLYGYVIAKKIDIQVEKL